MLEHSSVLEGRGRSEYTHVSVRCEKTGKEEFACAQGAHRLLQQGTSYDECGRCPCDVEEVVTANHSFQWLEKLPFACIVEVLGVVRWLHHVGEPVAE